MVYYNNGEMLCDILLLEHSSVAYLNFSHEKIIRLVIVFHSNILMYFFFFIFPTPSFFRFFLSPFFPFHYHPHPFLLNTLSLSLTVAFIPILPSSSLISLLVSLTFVFNSQFLLPSFFLHPPFFSFLSILLSLFSATFILFFTLLSTILDSTFFQILSPKIVALASEVKIHIF